MVEPAAMARALFIGGTASDVGKSLIVSGLCRLLKRQGGRVAPFKAQNMALNAAVTPEGKEIGRAQALQAAACGIKPEVAMNPVLLKPTSDTGSQVVLMGVPVGNMSAMDYHAYKDRAWGTVQNALADLRSRYEVIVMEGAGSVAEINLKDNDITNLRAAALAEASVILVADIDRGGVFASVLGTLELLEPEEKARVKGVIINKFRGDPALFQSGVEMMEQRTGVPVLGVVPYLTHGLPEEDSVALPNKGTGPFSGGVRVGVVRLPLLSNYTDFDPLERLPEVELRYLDRPDQIPDLDLLIVPGSKATLSDMQYLHNRGLARAIRKYAEVGGRVVGLCGGYQMLGRIVCDPGGIESNQKEVSGLGLLDLKTEIGSDKETYLAAGSTRSDLDTGLPAGLDVAGYEIHMGRTERGEEVPPFAQLTRRPGGETLLDGAVSASGRIWGTYLHGIFDSVEVRRHLLNTLRCEKGLPTLSSLPTVDLEQALDAWADHLGAHLDMAAIRNLVAGAE